ncbi:MAG: glycosyltransferase [Candidatus Saganbacteria bacterium]|nr:glycosyltransferase [Candidatus Saganbacteria bacterium]
MKRIAFFGFKNAIDYYQIGGTENYVRRIALNLSERGEAISYIIYGANQSKTVIVGENITLNYCVSFEQALKTIEEQGFDDVVCVYVLPKNRLRFFSFRNKLKGITKFHFIFFNWPDFTVKRWMYLNEARLLPYNGKLFCVSKRLYEYVSRWAKNAVLLLPPVPEEFFLKPEEKPVSSKIRITFLGRIDTGKGIGTVIELFDQLAKSDRFQCNIYGMHIKDDPKARAIHEWLRNQDVIRYVEVNRDAYTLQTNAFVANVLENTDIFLQPYAKLSSTIDTPVLILEAMASLCLVITKPFGNIPDIYGGSNYLMSCDNYARETLRLIKNISKDDLVEERDRLYDRNQKLDFKATSITERFINAISQ